MHKQLAPTILFTWPKTYCLPQSISLSSRSIMSFCSGLMYIRQVETSCWIRRMGYVTIKGISSRFLLFGLHFSKSKPPQFSNWGYSLFNTSWNSSTVALSGGSETWWLSCQEQLKIRGLFQWRMAFCLPSWIPNTQICGSNGFWTFY